MKKILVIEDNRELRENTVELLELAGYTVSTADNGTDGFLKAVNELPDVVLCDIVMPGSGGLSFLHLVKAQPATKHIPLIFFSAGSAPIAVQRGLQLGADEYLTKPFTNDELLSAVRRALDRRAIA